MIEGQPSPHLEPRTPAVDLACPGLMLAANAGLVLGYLWIGWFSTSETGPVVSAMRGAVLPAFIALTIFGLRRACIRRGLPGATTALPFSASLSFFASVAAALTESHMLALTAGATALLLALVAFASVIAREAARSTVAARLHSLRPGTVIARRST